MARRTALLITGKSDAMTKTDDHLYYAEREAAERRLAQSAVDPAVRWVHLHMAACYRDRAACAEEAEKAKANVD